MLGKLGKYEIRGEIGRGAMGAVYEGYDTAIGRRVAIKVLRTDTVNAAQLPELLERFRREAQAAGRLSHPHIVTIHDFGEDAGTPFIVMEHIAGRELGAHLDGGARFPLDRIERIMQQLLGALAHAHQHGIVHRDLKPSNMFLLQDGSLKVVDFGIARLESSDLTDTGAILGTPAYMSPEQCLGMQVDHRSDLYSAGVILYQLLTGEKPFTGSVASIIQKVLRQEPLPPSDLNPIIAQGWDGVVARAMAKKPEARFQSALQFADAVAAARRAAAPAQEDDTTVQLPPAARPAPEYPATVPLRPPPKAPPSRAAPAPEVAPAPAAAKAAVPSSPPPEGRRSRRPWIAGALVLVASAAAYYTVLRTPAERPAPTPAAQERETPRAMEERIRRELEGKLAAERAAAQQAAAEQKAKAAAEQKAAADRAAAKRAAEEREAAERAAAAKVAAERAAAEKAARQRAAAEKAAAEKAAQEKAAAERAAQQQAAAQRAAQQKAAAEKAAAEKAAAEKAAAERVAAAALAAAKPREIRWSGALQCEQYGPNPEQYIALDVKQSGDEFNVGFGTPNKPASLSLYGNRSQTGDMRLWGTGVSGSAGSYNSSYQASFSGRFARNHYQGEGRLGPRNCTLTLTGN